MLQAFPPLAKGGEGVVGHGPRHVTPVLRRQGGGGRVASPAHSRNDGVRGGEQGMTNPPYRHVVLSRSQVVSRSFDLDTLNHTSVLPTSVKRWM